MLWRVVVNISTLAVAIIAPLELSFGISVISGNQFSWLVTLVFGIDFMLNTRLYKLVRQERKEQLQHDNVCSPGFLLVVDFLSALPLELLLPVPGIGLVRLIKLLRVLHFSRTIRYSLVGFSNLFIFSQFVIWFSLVTHWLACGWHQIGGSFMASDLQSQYVDSIYWTVTTLSTVGYGDIVPSNNLQKLYAIAVQIIGFSVFGFIIGVVASRLLQKDPATSRYQENLEGLESLIHYRSLPKSLQNRIMRYYQYVWKKRVGYDETAFLESLPNSLQTEVALHLKRHVIEKVSLFRNASEGLKQRIALALHPVFLIPGDYIFKAGESGKEMYFVVNGELETLTEEEDRMLTKLKPGDYFGEIALFKNQHRTATVKANTYCDLYALDKKSFNKVMKKNPEIGQAIESIVIKRESQYTVS